MKLIIDIPEEEYKSLVDYENERELVNEYPYYERIIAYKKENPESRYKVKVSFNDKITHPKGNGAADESAHHYGKFIVY